MLCTLQPAPMHCALLLSRLALIPQVIWVLLPHGGVGQLPDHFLFTVVENYVTLGLFCDISMRAALQGRRFCREVGGQTYEITRSRLFDYPGLIVGRRALLTVI